MSAILDMHNIPGFGDVRTWGGRHHEQGFEPDGVGDPAQEIRDGFAARTTVPYYDHSDRCEKQCPTAEAILDAVSNMKDIGPTLEAALNGSDVHRHHLKAAIVRYWIEEQDEFLREYRRNPLALEPEQFIPSEAC